MSSGAPGNPRYRRYRPEPYRRRTPIFWWLGRLSYTRFISRELTSLGVAYAAVLLVVEAVSVRRGPAVHEAFVDWLRTPWVVAIHLALFAVVLFHTASWLRLAPQALVVRLGGRTVPGRAVAAAHFVAWAAVTVLIGWALLGG